MPDGGKEQVKIAPGERKPTSEVSLITAELGTLGNGKKALSMITMFPGGMEVDGVEIPMDRGQFVSKGLYFVVDPSSSLLKESIDINSIINEALKSYRKQLKENEAAKEKIYDFLNSDDIKQYTGVYGFETCSDDDWDKVKNYIEKDKENFLAQNEDITGEEFDTYYEEWVDYIEEQRGYENMNQQDMSYGY